MKKRMYSNERCGHSISLGCFRPEEQELCKTAILQQYRLAFPVGEPFFTAKETADV